MLARFAMGGINGVNTMIAVTLELGQTGRIAPRVFRRVACSLFFDPEETTPFFCQKLRISPGFLDDETPHVLVLQQPKCGRNVLNHEVQENAQPYIIGISICTTLCK